MCSSMIFFNVKMLFTLSANCVLTTATMYKQKFRIKIYHSKYTILGSSFSCF